MRLVPFLLLAALVNACASSKPAPPSGAAPAATRSSRGERGVITAQELASSNALNLFEAVQVLRPSFLVERGVTSIRNAEVTQRWVYVEHTRMGGISELRRIPIMGVTSVRFYTGPEATQLWGLNHSGGVIQVMLSR